jgi:hypothetical protein
MLKSMPREMDKWTTNIFERAIDLLQYDPGYTYNE